MHNCCARAAYAVEQQQLAAAAQAKTLADEAKKANERCCIEAVVLATAALANKQCHCKSTELAAALTVSTLAKEQTCHVAVEHAAAKTAAAVEMAIDLAM